MCKRKIKDAKVWVVKGKYTIVAIDRVTVDKHSKVMDKVDISAFNQEVDMITEEPIIVISHGGSVHSGHYCYL